VKQIMIFWEQSPSMDSDVKICNICETSKCKSSFNKHPQTLDGYLNKCKECLKTQRLRYKSENKEWIAKQKRTDYLKHKEKRDAKHKEWVIENKDRMSKVSKEWRNSNKETLSKKAKIYWGKVKKDKNEDRKEYAKRYTRLNRAKRNVINSRRRANKLCRTPRWLSELDLFKIGCFYDKAQEVTKALGIIHHVDHIIPLQGKNGSGFHCPSNLQVIPWYEKLRKGNKYENINIVHCRTNGF